MQGTILHAACLHFTQQIYNSEWSLEDKIFQDEEYIYQPSILFLAAGTEFYSPWDIPLCLVRVLCRLYGLSK